MRLSFKDRAIRKICEDSDEATNKYGAAIATTLMILLADLEAATNMADILLGNPGNGESLLDNQYKLDLAEDLQLILSVEHLSRPPMNSENRVDWQRVDYVKILEIRNING